MPKFKKITIMTKRNKLLKALNGLELSFKKKEEFVDTLLNNTSSDGSGSGVEVDDIIWYMDTYTGFSLFNISKGIYTGGYLDRVFLQDAPFNNETIELLYMAVDGIIIGSNEKIQITNLKAPIIRLNSDTVNTIPSLSGIKIEGSLLLSNDNIVNYKGTIGYGLTGGDVTGKWVIYLDEENKTLLDIYSESEIRLFSIKKLIASNGNEIEMITTWFLTEENQQDIKKVFEDLFSQIAVKYVNEENFDDSLELYGYKIIYFEDSAFTRVGRYSINQYDGVVDIYLMLDEGNSPSSGLRLRKDIDGYHLDYMG